KFPAATGSAWHSTPSRSPYEPSGPSGSCFDAVQGRHNATVPPRSIANYDVRLSLMVGWTSYIVNGKIGSMPRRTDTRSRMIHAAVELFRQRGYHATTFSDVVRESGAPRGSTYFHFPGGKAELAREAIARAGDEVEELVDEAARHADDPASLIRAMAHIHTSRLERSGYQ